LNEDCLVPWPEHQVPAGETDCTDCGLFRHGSRMVWGEGNPEAPVMIILDNPGAREDREGNPFVCGTRATMRQAARMAGFRDEDLYVTYILKRRPRRAYDKDQARAACMRHLLLQLAVQSPRWILCLGNVAVRAFFAQADAEVKTMRQQWHLTRGFSTTVSYHPLAVRRRPNLWPYFVEDWKLVKAKLDASRGSP
jgi:Uracil-DNA glycosylase